MQEEGISKKERLGWALEESHWLELGRRCQSWRNRHKSPAHHLARLFWVVKEAQKLKTPPAISGYLHQLSALFCGSMPSSSSHQVTPTPLRSIGNGLNQMLLMNHVLLI